MYQKRKCLNCQQHCRASFQNGTQGQGLRTTKSGPSRFVVLRSTAEVLIHALNRRFILMRCRHFWSLHVWSAAMRIHFSIQSLAAGTVIGEEKRYPAGHARLAYLQTLATCRNRIVTQPFRTCSAIHLDPQRSATPLSATVMRRMAVRLRWLVVLLTQKSNECSI